MDDKIPPSQLKWWLIASALITAFMGYDIATQAVFPKSISMFFLAVWGLVFWLLMVGAIAKQYPMDKWGRPK